MCVSSSEPLTHFYYDHLCKYVIHQQLKQLHDVDIRRSIRMGDIYFLRVRKMINKKRKIVNDLVNFLFTTEPSPVR